MRKIPVPLDTLRRLYVEDKLTLRQIGDRFGISKQAIHERLVRAGVPRRPRSVIAHRFDEQQVYDLYVVKGLTIPETAEKLRVTRGKLALQLKRQGIQRRKRGPRPVPNGGVCGSAESEVTNPRVLGRFRSSWAESGGTERKGAEPDKKDTGTEL